MRKGIDNTLVLTVDTTYEEVEFVKQLHNRFHGGQATTLAECYNTVSICDREWEAYRIKEHITVNGSPKKGPFRYEKRYEGFVMDKYGKLYGNWETFDNCKSVVHALDAQKSTTTCWKAWRQQASSIESD